MFTLSLRHDDVTLALTWRYRNVNYTREAAAGDWLRWSLLLRRFLQSSNFHPSKSFLTAENRPKKFHTLRARWQPTATPPDFFSAGPMQNCFRRPCLKYLIPMCRNEHQKVAGPYTLVLSCCVHHQSYFDKENYWHWRKTYTLGLWCFFFPWVARQELHCRTVC